MRFYSENLMIKIFCILILGIILDMSNAQTKNLWNCKKCAVSLTYDDALNVHLDNVQPILDSLKFRGTFYVPVSFPGFKTRLQDWRALAGRGHELGNHTIFHPCAGGYEGREWVQPDYDLTKYTVKRIVDEIEAANVTLTALDSKTDRTFAYPCGDTLAGDSSYILAIKPIFAGARSVTRMMQQPAEIDLCYIGSYMINGESGTELTKLVDEAIRKEALLVFLFHGVGGEHDLNVSLEAHNELLHYLKMKENEIWVAPLIEIAEYIKLQKHN